MRGRGSILGMETHLIVTVVMLSLVSALHIVRFSCERLVLRRVGCLTKASLVRVRFVLGCGEGVVEQYTHVESLTSGVLLS
ncbi:hypothetical protein Tco_1135348 [Tanacetum coccineum]